MGKRIGPIGPIARGTDSRAGEGEGEGEGDGDGDGDGDRDESKLVGWESFGYTKCIREAL